MSRGPQMHAAECLAERLVGDACPPDADATPWGLLTNAPRLSDMTERIATDTPASAEDTPRAIITRPSVDEMSEWSFPASDPPATWTWDVDPPRHD
jgi:hypothetical protein